MFFWLCVLLRIVLLFVISFLGFGMKGVGLGEVVVGGGGFGGVGVMLEEVEVGGWFCCGLVVMFC